MTPRLVWTLETLFKIQRTNSSSFFKESQFTKKGKKSKIAWRPCKYNTYIGLNWVLIYFASRPSCRSVVTCNWPWQVTTIDLQFTNMHTNFEKYVLRRSLFCHSVLKNFKQTLMLAAKKLWNDRIVKGLPTGLQEASEKWFYSM